MEWKRRVKSIRSSEGEELNFILTEQKRVNREGGV